jgi:hypothetical protein
MDQQPKIPTLKDAQKPQVKIKGMGAGLTLFDRLKQFKKKDLAFILAGLGTLFMAPLAEHFMMAPENGDASLQQGWGKGGAAGTLFSGNSSPYENGNNSIASGGAIGGSGDIITPLNVRDPSALVMGPGAAQQPNAGSIAPAAPPPTAPASSETDYRDALKGAATRAASAAIKKAPLPVPKVALGGSGLRGLGVAGGGTSASGSLGPIGPAAGSTGGGGGGGLNLVRNTPGFKSAAGARSPTGGTGFDGTKRAGANAGDAFSRTGSALSGLNAAASEQIPTGGQGYGGGGQGGSGANDKPYSGSGPGGSKSVGESLAFLEAKQRQEERLKLEFEKKKLKDPELLLYGIRNDSLKAMASEMTKSLTKGILGFMDPSAAGASDFSCQGTINGPVKRAQMSPACGDGSNNTPSVPTGGCWKISGKIAQHFPSGNSGADVTCTANGDATDSKSAAERAATTATDRLANGAELSAGAPTVGAGLDGGCAGLAALALPPKPVNGAVPANIDAGELPHYQKMQAGATNLGTARTLLNGEGSASACGAKTPGTEDKTAVALQAEALQKLQAVLPALNTLVIKAKDGDVDLKTNQQSVEAAAKLVGVARSQIDAAKTLIAGAGPFASYEKNKTKESEAATQRLTDAKTELGKQQVSIDGTQKGLEAALKKAQDTVIGDGKDGGTLGTVLVQNQAFIDMRSTLDTKKTEFAKTAADEKDKASWAAVTPTTVPDPKAVTAGGSAEPAVVSKDVTAAAESIKKVCDKIGGCTAAPAAGAAAPAAAPAGGAAPKYDEVSALFQPATDGVSTMRQVQSNAISGLNADLTKLGAAK